MNFTLKDTGNLTLGIVASSDIGQQLSNLSIAVVIGGVITLIVIAGLAIHFNKRRQDLKKILFGSFLIITAMTTLLICGSAIFINLASPTKGPINWSADIEFWACDTELNLRDPSGFWSNKIGSKSLHEHNDKRIHLEGVPAKLPDDATLGKFMNAVGGSISEQFLLLPIDENDYTYSANAQATNQLKPFLTTGTDGQYAKFVSGASCGDQQAELQVFVYNFNQLNKTYSQVKLATPQAYEISHFDDIPPGDCIIVEFGPNKDRTDRLCKNYGQRDTKRCAEFGVPADKRKSCDIREVAK